MKDVYSSIFAEWKERHKEGMLPRANPLSKYMGMKPRKIIAATGLRRVGKTCMLYQLAGTEREKILYINFDDERIPARTDFLTGLVPAIKNMLDVRPETLFLDEVHRLPDWSRWLRRIYDEGEFEIFVTGSGAQLSSEEIPYELRGRCMEVRVRPLTYAEFLGFKDKGATAALLEEYLLYGGMPEVVLAGGDVKLDLLRQYYSTVIRRDIIERFRIRNSEALKAMLKLLANSTQFSFTKLYNTIRSMQMKVGKTAILKYMSHVESSYLLRSVPILSPKVKDQMRHPRKVYFEDTGFVSALSTRFSKNYGRLCENAVANGLSSRGYTLHYWKSVDGREVDFAVRADGGVEALVQACWEPWEDSTLKREMSALATASSELSCSELLVVTKDKVGVEEHRGKKIRFVRLGDWLLGA